MPKTESKNVFENFTNLYELSKTLRFELKPVEETKKLLDIENERKENFKHDRKIKEAYLKMKKILDDLHAEFIEESMSDFLDFKNGKGLLNAFFEKYKQYKKNKENKDFSAEIKKLEKIISKNFDRFESEKYKVEKNKSKNKKEVIKFSKSIILSEKVLDILEKKIKDEKDLEVIRTFRKFFTYLGGYNQSRENYYKSENKSGQFATRAIKDNLIKFLNNCIIFEDKYKNNWQKIGLSEKSLGVFNLNFYNDCLLRGGIDNYNAIVGGSNEDNNKKTQGINEKINEYRQKHKKDENFKKENFPYFVELYKQIGSPRNEEYRFIEINDDRGLIYWLREFIGINKPKREKSKEILRNFFNKNNKEFSKVYLPKNKASQLSHQIFSDWRILMAVFNTDNEDKKNEYVSFEEIKKHLNNLEEIEFRKFYKDSGVYDKNKSNFENFLAIWGNEFEILFSGGRSVLVFQGEEKNEDKASLEESEKRYLEKIFWLEEKIRNKQKISNEEEKKFVEIIKNYLDRILAISQMADYLYLKDEWRNKIDAEDLDHDFYKEYDEYKKEVSDYNPRKYYDEFRNYITKRSIVGDKIKLNFNDGQLLTGWDLNKEKEKFGLVFRKNDKYYLGIINKEKDKNIFEKNQHPEVFDAKSDFEKMEYKLFPDPKRMIPKVSFSEKAKIEYGIPDEILAIKKDYEKFQEGKKDDKKNWNNKFDKIKLEKLIAYYQDCLVRQGYQGIYKFQWKKAGNYRSLGEFNDEIEKHSFKICFVKVDESYLKECIKNEKLYLFQIYNKDFSEFKKDSKENLHTIYFKELFSGENLKNPIFKLSGGAEVFFRDKLENQKIKYYKQVQYDGKHNPLKDKDGNIIVKELTNTKSVADGKKVIEHRRFAENKILFHLPITINFGSGKLLKFNQKINELIADNKNINIIGIDRGEKHIAYYFLMDQNGKKIESGSLNEVNGINYHQKLKERADERTEARRNWQKIESIKNLKVGYISAVVKKIANLAIENNSIVIFEDLNTRFKQKRGAFEHSAYQQLEKALIQKLNFFTDKEKKNHRKALQLTAPFTSFQDMGKQTGIIFYTQASYTSKTCPVCGFRQRKYIYYKNIDQAIKDFEDISINYEKKNDRFCFKYGFAEKYRKNNKDEINKGVDEVYSDALRSFWNSKYENNKGKIELLKKGEITKKLKDVFEKGFGIIIDGEINKDLNKKNDKKYAKSWSELVWLFNLILRIRNTDKAEERNEADFIFCPKCHFDSRSEKAMIKNGDENGAYNIARRGLMIVRKIKNAKNVSKLRWQDLHISKKDWDDVVEDWDKFVQQK